VPRWSYAPHLDEPGLGGRGSSWAIIGPLRKRPDNARVESKQFASDRGKE
jgi:hypothetical protein